MAAILQRFQPVQTLMQRGFGQTAIISAYLTQPFSLTVGSAMSLLPVHLADQELPDGSKLHAVVELIHLSADLTFDCRV
jgi:hypothetical protein